jgi:hypothetical protein
MQLDHISDSDLLDLHRLSREMLTAMYRAKIQDTILADLLDEFEQQTTTLCRHRFAPPQSTQNAAAN